MKIYIKTDINGKLTEAGTTKIDGAEIIEATAEQFELIQKQYDTYIENEIITKQEKGQDAINLDNILVNENI